MGIELRTRCRATSIEIEPLIEGGTWMMVDDICCAGRNLVIIEFRKYVLGISQSDSLSIFVQHVGVHEM